MSNPSLNQQTKTLTAHNDFEIRGVCDLNYFDITSEYSSFHNHDFYEYFLVIKGKGVHFVNNVKVPLYSHMLVALKPTDTHAFKLLEDEEMRILNLAFCKEIALPLIEMIDVDIFPLHILLSESQSSEIVNQYQNIHVKLQQDNLDKTLLKALFAYLFSTAILNNSKEELESSSFPDWLKQSIRGLSEKDNCAQGLSYLIKTTKRNQSYLCRIFRRYLDCTPTEYINSIRLKNACTLLRYTQNDILDICYDCGFSSVSHFNHLFKKSYDISPTDYRRRLL